jgi:DNA gyrase/topoisomerase IV subunit A
MTESRDEREEDTLTLVTQTDTARLRAIRQGHFEGEIALKTFEPQKPLRILHPNDRALLITTDWRCFLKYAGQLADLDERGLNIAEVEEFHRDEFGEESVCTINRWHDLQDAHWLLLMSTLGYGRLFAGKTLLENIDRPLPYQLLKSRGYPSALVRVQPGDELVVISHAGRAIRMKADQLALSEERFLSVPLRGNIISALAIHPSSELLIATASGYARRLHSETIPLTAEFNTTGHKIVGRTNPVTALAYQPDKRLWAITNKRLLPVAQRDIPFENANDYQLVRLKKGERLVTLLYLD